METSSILIVGADMSHCNSRLIAAILSGLVVTSVATPSPASPCKSPEQCRAGGKTTLAKAIVDPALASSVAAAVPSAVAQTLGGSYPYILYGSDYGMQCNGWADDTAGLNGVMAAAQANSGAANALASGVRVILPGGLCLISGAISVAVTKSMSVAGLGIGATHLEWTAPTNGLMFTVSNSASLTVSDMTISKKVGTNPSGSTFTGQAVSIAAGGPDLTIYKTYLPRHQNVGSVTVANLSIYPGIPNGQTDGWAVGLHLTDLPGPTVSNVSVNMPGWSKLPNPGNLATPISSLPSPTAPGPFNNGASVPTSGTTGAGSKAAYLGIGVADGILIQGTESTPSDPNAVDYAIDSVISDVSMSGGLVGLDLYRFQGAYISSLKSVADVIGLRADTPDNVTELVSITASMFTDIVDGIYLNGVAGSNINGNYFLPGATSTPGLPTWTAIWARNGTNNMIADNNINGVGSSAANTEYGIYLTNDAGDGTGGFPNTLSGNVLAQLNGVCIGNDKNVTAITASNNSLRACATYIGDSAANVPYWPDDNSYVDNISNHPDMIENSNGLELPEALTVGSFADVGSIKVLSNNVQTFLLDGSGNLAASGNLTIGGSITAAGSLTAGGSLASGGTVTAAGLFSAGGKSHTVVQEAAGGWGGGGSVIPLMSPSGGLPALTGVSVMAVGELYCISGGFRMAWHVLGHWALNGAAATVQNFAATAETDVDTTWALQTLNGAITPGPMPNNAGIVVTVGSGFGGIVDCTTDLHELIVD